MSSPSPATQASEPRLTGDLPKRWVTLSASPLTVTKRSSGSPELTPHWPPIRSVKLAPAQPRRLAEAHGDGIPVKPTREVPNTALAHPADEERRIARGSTPGIVGDVGDHDRPALDGGCLTQATSTHGRDPLWRHAATVELEDALHVLTRIPETPIDSSP